MSSTDLVLQMIRLLDQLAIPYMLVGAYSSNFYGRPRSTDDADFVVVLQSGQLTQLQQALGSDFKVDAQMGFESITMHTRYLIVHRESAFEIELFLLSDDPFNQSRFERRRQVEFRTHKTWLPSPEDVIVQKLLWSKSPNRQQDVADVRTVIQVQRDAGLDLDYIRRWTSEHGTRELFEALWGAILKAYPMDYGY